MPQDEIDMTPQADLDDVPPRFARAGMGATLAIAGAAVVASSESTVSLGIGLGLLVAGGLALAPVIGPIGARLVAGAQDQRAATDGGTNGEEEATFGRDVPDEAAFSGIAREEVGSVVEDIMAEVEGEVDIGVEPDGGEDDSYTVRYERV